MTIMNDKARRFHLVGHGHLDPVFMWRWQEGYEAARATFRSVLDRMNEFPDFRFTSTTTALLVAIEEHDPAMFREISQRVEQGRWELAGGWWVEPDTNLVHGESLVRQALHGQLELRRMFGRIATIGMNPDTFGHSAVLPQLLRLSGADAYVFMRPERYESTINANGFSWAGDAGAELPAWRLQSYNAVPSVELFAQEPFYAGEHQLIVYGVGNHGGGPTIAALRQIEQARNDDLDYASLADFAAAAAAGLDKRVSGELQHHARGCYSTTIGLKQANRRAEHALLAAERWASLASAHGHAYPAERLTAAWRDVLWNQFHDVLPGTCLREAEEDALQQLGRARFSAAEALHYAVNHLAARVDTATEHTPFILFNPATSDLDGIVELEVDIRHWERGNPGNSQIWWLERNLTLQDGDGNVVPHNLVQPAGFDGNTNRLRVAFRASVPALGYAVYQYADARPSSPSAGCKVEEDAAGLTVSNGSLSLSICRDTGAITSWFDHEQGCELLNGPSDVLTVFNDPSDTWAHEVRAFTDRAGEFGSAEVTVSEHGPVRTVLTIRSRFGRSQAVRTIAVPAGGSEVAIETRVNWQEQHRVLKSVWQLNLSQCQQLAASPYRAVERKPGAGEEPGGEWLCLNGEARDDQGRWLDTGWRFVNDSCWAYGVESKYRRYSWGQGETTLGLTLLRSPIYAFHEPNEPLADRHYDYQNQGWHTYRFAIRTGQPQTAVVATRAAELLNQEPVVVREHQHPGQLPRRHGFLVQDAPEAMLSVLKRSEADDGFVLRAVDAGAGGPASFSIAALGLQASGQLAPFEIASWDSSRNRLDLLEQPLEEQ